MADDEFVIVDSAGQEHAFPAGFDPQRAAAIVRLDSTPKDNTGGEALGLTAAEPAANLATRFAMSPTAARTGGVLGRIAGAVAPPIAGAVSSGPAGFAKGLWSAPIDSWAGGKVGYFGTKMLQSAARPIGSALETVAPYAHALSGAQGVGALAQMAEPNRRDIGFLGIGSGTPDPAHPALINDYAAKLRDYVLGKLRHDGQ